MSHAESSGRRRLSTVSVLGLLLVLVGLGALGWVGYQYFGTNVVARRAFDSEKEGLRAQWQQGAAGERQHAVQGRDANGAAGGQQGAGEAIGLLRVPKFGDDYEVPILSGTDLDTLSRGVGHYSSTAEAGQVGNFALAGHRVTHGQPFARLLELDKGDRVVVETETSVFTYVVDAPPRSLTVSPSAAWVLDPVPGKPTATPTQALLTLTTCQDLFHSPDRSVGFAHLASTKNKG